MNQKFKCQNKMKPWVFLIWEQENFFNVTEFQ